MLFYEAGTVMALILLSSCARIVFAGKPRKYPNWSLGPQLLSEILADIWIVSVIWRLLRLSGL